MLTDEDINFMTPASLGLSGETVKDDELIAVVLIDFRALPAALDVFQRQRMKLEFPPDAGNLLRSRIDDVDPDRGVLVLDDLVEILELCSGDRSIRTSMKDDLDHG
jgi:hypothetical protein